MILRAKRLFTLIEIMVAIALLTMASSVVGLKMYKAVQKKQFQSEIERLKTRCLICQKLAVASQSDWQGIFKKKGKEWIFETRCDELAAKRFAPLHLKAAILFNQKNINELTIDFFASGQVAPEGTFAFSYNSDQIILKTADLFQRNQGQKLGPIHPNE